ncbi:MAG: hypothetical protein LH609_09895, partial [Rudanella sp.]|nr:hypothetical protein [Rudanella sp.]
YKEALEKLLNFNEKNIVWNVNYTFCSIGYIMSRVIENYIFCPEAPSILLIPRVLIRSIIQIVNEKTKANLPQILSDEILEKSFLSKIKAALLLQSLTPYLFTKDKSRHGVVTNLANKFIPLVKEFIKIGFESFVILQIVHIWNDDLSALSNSLDVDEQIVSENKAVSDFFSTFKLLELLLKLLLAKKQYHTAYNYFQQEEWQLKNRFKPLYYATLHFLQDEHPTDYLRMGPELRETVDDVLAEVAQMAIDYA